jgi:NAD(P)-dependent dehydrogenase (short-subunit alcohol dehydrogenase family)
VGNLDGKVAFITGAARGQGRSHALRLAEEDADIIGLDICQDMATVPYPLATEADLEENAAEVARLGRTMVTAVADVRDPEAIERVVKLSVGEFGGMDIVVANAGICPIGSDAPAVEPFLDVVDVNLTGVWNTVRATAPILIE